MNNFSSNPDQGVRGVLPPWNCPKPRPVVRIPPTPVQVVGVGGVGFLSGITAIAAGYGHTCAVSSSGSVYCWGTNDSGQLGNHSLTAQIVPVQVVGVGNSGFLSDITGVSASLYDTCAFSSVGHVYCWGVFLNGGFTSTTPVETSNVGGSGFLVGVSGGAVGPASSCAVVGGAVACWGDNSVGEWGNGSTTSSVNPVGVYNVTSAGGLTGISAVVMSALQSACALSSSGIVFCWGENANGQLGVNNTTNESVPVQVLGVGGTGAISNVASISPSQGKHFCAASSSGSVYCWGNNDSGQLGNNSTTEVHVPTLVY